MQSNIRVAVKKVPDWWKKVVWKGHFLCSWPLGTLSFNMKHQNLRFKLCLSILIMENNSIVKSMRSISKKRKFYRRAVSKFLYAMCNQSGMFYSFYWEYELKILRVSVKMAYLGIYFTENYAKRRLTWFTVLLRLQHFNGFSNFRAERGKNYWLYRKKLQTKVA